MRGDGPFADPQEGGQRTEEGERARPVLCGTRSHQVASDRRIPPRETLIYWGAFGTGYQALLMERLFMAEDNKIAISILMLWDTDGRFLMLTAFSNQPLKQTDI